MHATAYNATAGSVDALTDAREYLKAAIEMRLNYAATDSQVVILFCHGAVEDAALDEAKEVLSLLMDSGVYVVAVSKSWDLIQSIVLKTWQISSYRPVPGQER